MLASRMSKFSGSATTAVSDKVAELRAAGKNIISLNVGVMHQKHPPAK